MYSSTQQCFFNTLFNSRLETPRQLEGWDHVIFTSAPPASRTYETLDKYLLDENRNSVFCFVFVFSQRSTKHIRAKNLTYAPASGNKSEL